MQRLHSHIKEPLTWIAIGALVLHAVGIGWGLPSSIGWDNDGVAPRDFLFGVVRTYQPGSFYTYPPVHLLLLTLLTAPTWLAALTRVSSFESHAVVSEFVKVPYMTAFSLVARLVSLAMATGVILTLAAMGRELAGRKVGRLVALLASVDVVFNYYAHTSNLDVPYLFWATLALLSLMRALVRREPRRLRSCLLFAALSVGTKDQAYALFIVTVPTLLAAWCVVEPWGREHRYEIAREVVRGALLALGMLLLLAGLPVNPVGFLARLRFLAGTASQDHALYAANLHGFALVFRDTALGVERHYPWAYAPLFIIGLYVQLRRSTDRRTLLAGLVPLLAMISFTVAFNCSARRTEDRFLMPQMMLFSVYAGLGWETLLFQRSRWVTRLARAAFVPLFMYALYRASSVNAALLGDPRYEAEAWMKAHVEPGEGVETYGNDAYLPRFPETMPVVRVDPGPLEGRSRIPGLSEVVAPFEDIEKRKPIWIVLGEAWAWRYLDDIGGPTERGKQVSPAQVARYEDVRSREFFRRLVHGEEHYVLSHTAMYRGSFFPSVDIHASTAKRVWIFRRASLGG